MPRLVIIYGTGSHNTELIARALEEGARGGGADTVLKNVNDAAVEDLLGADAVAIGSPNYNRMMMPTIRRFIESMAGAGLSGKVGLAFGSYGWSKEAVNTIHTMLASYGLDMADDLLIKRTPGKPELEECRRRGAELVRRVER